MPLWRRPGQARREPAFPWWPKRSATWPVERLKRHTDLPIAVGFGIKTPEQAAEVAATADAAVVGSALVDRIKASLTEDGNAGPDTVEQLLGLVSELAEGVRGQSKR